MAADKTLTLQFHKDNTMDSDTHGNQCERRVAHQHICSSAFNLVLTRSISFPERQNRYIK